VRGIVGLYLNPPDHAIVLCVDRKSQVQALNRTQPILRPRGRSVAYRDPPATRNRSDRLDPESWNQKLAAQIRSNPKTPNAPIPVSMRTADRYGRITDWYLPIRYPAEADAAHSYHEEARS
jgi:hypothetical protein